MAASPKLDPKLRIRLMRYIHTGMEEPKYFPGCWKSHKYFEVDKLKAIDEAFQDDSNNVEVVNVIVKAYKDGWFTRYETIVFSLAKCLLTGGPAVKEAAYKAVSKVCETSEQLMIFTKFTRLLKTGNGQGWCRSIRAWYNKKSPLELAKEITRVRARHGRSHKTLLRKCHFKVDEADTARDAVVKYALFGLKQAKQLMGNAEGTKEVFECIQHAEDMRHCEDPEAAAAIAERHQFTLDHVPGHLLTSQDVWNSILPQFTLEEILENIQRIHNMGLFVSESATTAIVLSLLNNADLIKKSKVTPLHVYITLANYNKNSRPLKFTKAKVALEKEQRRRTRQVFDTTTGLWQWTVTRRHPKEIKHWGIDKPPNPAIVAALNKLIDHSWLLTPATGASYLITMDMRHHMFKGRHFCKSLSVPKKKKKMSSKPSTTAPAAAAPATAGAGTAAAASPAAGGDANNAEKKSKKQLLAECFYNTHVTPGHAAIVTALHILKREKNVKLAVFTEECIQFASIERNFSSIDEAEFVLRKANVGRVQMDAPINWAMKSDKKIDVFINMVDRTTRCIELEKEARGGRGPAGRYLPAPPTLKEIDDHCPVRALERYRRAKNVPNAKLVVMSLASHRVQSTDASHVGVLDVVGVDRHVPQVLDAFVLGQFK